MGKIKINKERCKGCNICITVCPKGSIKICNDYNSKGLHYVTFVENKECTGCSICAINCPDVAIEVEK